MDSITLVIKRAILSGLFISMQSLAGDYTQTDWSGFNQLPAFEAGNRINAYQVYLSMEAELLAQ